MGFILGLDMGIASVGYAVIDDQYNTLISGVRLFPEGGAEGNVERRGFRSSRRSSRRRQHRLARLKRLFEIIFSLPKNSLNDLQGDTEIYSLRVKGLTEKLSVAELITAVLNLAKHRGIFYLTPNDLVPDGGESISSVDALSTNEHKLKDGMYPCHAQLEKLRITGEVRGLENKFTHDSYKSELIALLEHQSEFYPQIELNKNLILDVYDSKREYYQGPGSEKSPTPYGAYRYDEYGNVIHVNLIDQMRGKCTYYPTELRAPKGSYSACLFNLLNDLNNLTVNGIKLSKDEKQVLINEYVNKGKPITIATVARVCDVNKEDIFGYRIDKSEKPLFTKFDGYNELLKIAKSLNKEDIINGNVQLVDDIAEILTKEKSIDLRRESLIALSLPDDLADMFSKASGFTAYHSLSFKAMQKILVDLLETSKNQMELFTAAGVKPANANFIHGDKLSVNLSDWIVSPVVKRTINETIKVFNELRDWLKKEYGNDAEFTDVVVELAREKNSEDRKAFLKKMQEVNEKRRKHILEIVENRKLEGTEFERVALWLEQDSKCAYSLEPIELEDIFRPGILEIDHIIPLSISLSDAQSNKVLVYASENQRKKQRTPFQYMSSGEARVTFDAFKDAVNKNPNYNKAKKRNLLYLGNPLTDLKGFIERNLVDTRYASKELHGLLKAFFTYNNINTRVKVINGAATSYFRKKAFLSKDRATTYAHHAQDAMIIAGFANTRLVKIFSKLGAFADNLKNKDQIIEVDGIIINSETGEILEEELFGSDKNVSAYIRYLKHIESVQPLYSHKVDRKPNRGLYNQQLKSTRTMLEEGKEKTYVITKYSDIYNTSSGNNGIKLKKMILESPEKLLMYHYDTKTYDIFKKIVEQYGEDANPFASYKEEHGPIRKYSKNGTGPIIQTVRFKDTQLGSHRVNSKQQGKNQSVYLKIKSLRTDIYQDGDYYKVLNVPYDMVSFKNNMYVIDEKKYNRDKAKQGISDKAIFVTSLYRGDYITYEYNGQIEERIFKILNNENTHRIEVSFVDKPVPSKSQLLLPIKTKVKNLTKYNVDVLGRKYKVTNEKLKFDVTI